MVAYAVALAALCFAPAPDDELICVAPDRWAFCTAETKQRFVPFGTSFVLADKRYLNTFDPELFDKRYYNRLLGACAGLGLNVVRVFLPISAVLPDPQAPGEARIAPGYLENLDEFLRLCRAHHMRAIVALAPWGGNKLRWWHEGGEYFGRHPWKADAGVDSVDVLCRFWAKLCAHLRGNPAVFAYSPCVEWSLPNMNLTWLPPGEQRGRVTTAPGLWYWRAFVRAKYGTVAALNRAWGTAYREFDEVPLVDYTWDGKRKRYADPERKILDYQNFREWASLRYLRPQIAAIRAADPTHLVTISNHGRQPFGLWEGAAQHFMGLSIPEQAPLVDFYTIHHNESEAAMRRRGWTLREVCRALVLGLRFCCAREVKPVLLEEFSFAADDPQRSAAGQEQMVRASLGHCSGWMTWYLQFPARRSQADPAQGKSFVLDENLAPSPWGRRAQELSRPGGLLWRESARRLPARQVVALRREEELLAKGPGTMLNIIRRWEGYSHPLDFRWPRNPDIALRLKGEREGGY